MEALTRILKEQKETEILMPILLLQDSKTGFPGVKDVIMAGTLGT